VTGSLPETERSPSQAASPSERETAPRGRERGTKREATPSERPEGQ
jgi:hypothetical protein